MACSGGCVAHGCCPCSGITRSGGGSGWGHGGWVGGGGALSIPPDLGVTLGVVLVSGATCPGSTSVTRCMACVGSPLSCPGSPSSDVSLWVGTPFCAFWSVPCRSSSEFLSVGGASSSHWLGCSANSTGSWAGTLSWLGCVCCWGGATGCGSSLPGWVGLQDSSGPPGNSCNCTPLENGPRVHSSWGTGRPGVSPSPWRHCSGNSRGTVPASPLPPRGACGFLVGCRCSPCLVVVACHSLGNWQRVARLLRVGSSVSFVVCTACTLCVCAVHSCVSCRTSACTGSLGCGGAIQSRSWLLMAPHGTPRMGGTSSLPSGLPASGHPYLLPAEGAVGPVTVGL